MPRPLARHRPTPALLISTFACAVLLAFPAIASAMLVEMDVEELADVASDVVVGQVVSVRTVADPDEDIVTEVVIRADRSLKGSDSGRRTVTLRVPGGSLGDDAVVVPNAPSFAPGERVVVFADGQGRVVGGRQGRLGIVGQNVPELGLSLARLETRVTGNAYAGTSCHLGAEEVAVVIEDETGSDAGLLETLSAPAIAGISPGAAAAGIGDRILITGSGFGAQPGAVLFPTSRDGQSTITGEVVSWSDTAVQVVVPARRIDGRTVGASSGPVRIRTADEALSAGHDFHVTFAYSGLKYVDTAQTFRYDPAGGVPGTLDAVRAAARAWTNASGISLSYAGSGTLDTTNDINEVGWRSLEPGVLGRAFIRFNTQTGEIIATDFAYSTAYAWGDGTGGTRDLETVALHEMGHWLYLLDLYGEADRTKVMCGHYTGVKRELHPSDRAGARWVYGENDGIEVVRVSGDNRYETAIKTSRENFAVGSARDVVIASGASYPDALAASGLAGSLGSPLLLTHPASLSAGVAEELERLDAQRVWVVGGRAVVSDSVVAALTSRGLAVERVAGPDRYHTAAEVARRIAAREGAEFERSVFVARGDDFADALAAAPYAYRLVRPVLLVSPDDTQTATRRAIADLGISEVIVVGGASAVSKAVLDDLAARTGATPLRLAGSNRYETARAIVHHALAEGWCTAAEIGITAGTDFPDALGGGAALGSQSGIVLLTPPTSLCSHARTLLDTYADDVTRIQVFGGRNAVDPVVFSEVCSVLEN